MMAASVAVQSSKRAPFAAVWANDGSVEWVDFPSRRLRVEAMELVERWLRDEVEGVYLGRRDPRGEESPAVP